MRKQTYVVKLTAKERERLKDLTRKGKSPARRGERVLEPAGRHRVHEQPRGNR